MKTFSVEAQQDLIEKKLTAKNNIDAISELIWNGLDADALNVRVSFNLNKLEGIEEIIVEDDGHGLPFSEAEKIFSKLGDSWKKYKEKTNNKKRLLHGKQGWGRFKAFTLGNSVDWTFYYQDNGEISEYELTGRKNDLKNFGINDPKKSDRKTTGAIVRITNIQKNPSILLDQKPLQPLTEIFALYLQQYKDVSIAFDGIRLDSNDKILNKQDFELSFRFNNEEVKVNLTIIEWKSDTKSSNSLYVCDKDGFTLTTIDKNIKAPGFFYTAYLMSDYFKVLEEKNELTTGEFKPDFNEIIDTAKEKIKEHFRIRASEQSRNLVDSWKKDKIYPYAGNPEGPVEQAEQQVFDIVALNVHSYMRNFDDIDAKNKRFLFMLLKQSLETSPQELQKILYEILELPKEKQKDLADLLERTSLDAIINASKIIANRVDFLNGLENLIYEKDLKKRLLERKHLHKLLEENTWIFGEEFNLTASDESLTNAMKRHIKLSENFELLDNGCDHIDEITRDDGSKGILDLMLSRAIKPRPNEREHLIVELKRPSVKIDRDALTQIESYADALSADEHFIVIPNSNAMKKSLLS